MVEFDLPEGWCLTKIGDVCSKITDGSHNPPSASTEGLPMLSAKNIHNGIVDFNIEHRLIPHDDFFIEDKRTNIQANDVLLTIVGALGRTALVVKDYTKFTLQRSVAVLAAPHLYAKCFRYSLEEYQFQKQIIDNAKGTAQKGIYLKKLSELTLPIPPLAEQSEIANRLDTLLAQVEATQARLASIPDIIKQFRQSVLAAALSGKLTEKWRNINNVKIQEWSSKALADIASVIDPNPSHRYPEPEAQGVPILSTQQFIGDSGWTKEKSKLVSKSFHSERMGKCGFFEGDIVFARKGRLGLARFSPSGFDYVYSHTLFIVRAKKEVYPKFLLWSLRPNSVVEHLLTEMNSNTGVPTLGKSVFERMKICLPSYIEQTEIVHRVEQLFAYADTIEQQAKAAKERVDNLTQAILAKAFRGELTADWRAANPDLISGDNSAAALLARIQAERATAKPRKRASKPAISPTSSGVTQ